MKLTIFCSPERKKVLLEVSSLFEEMFIETHAFFPENFWSSSTLDTLNEGLAYAEHFLIFPVESDLQTQWFSYILGSAGQKDHQVLINLEGNFKTSDYANIVSCCFWSESLEALKADLESIIPEWDKETRKRVAMKVLEEQLDDHVFEGLARSVEKGDRFMVGIYLEAGFDINKESMDHVTLIGLSARKGFLSILEILHKAGGDLNRVSSDRDNSALMDASSEGHLDIVKYLIKHEAELETKSKSGQTALALAVGNKKLDCAIELIKAGADPDSRDSLGLSARKYAELYGMQEILDILPEKQGDA